MRRVSVLPATAGALAYTLSKVDLAFRGELGMPGFPAAAASYDKYDPFTGQLSNAAVGLLLAVTIATLAWSPARPVIRRAVLAVNGIGLVLVTGGVIGFAARATGIAPGLGEPAEGVAAWVALAVGAGWVSAWAVAVGSAGTDKPSHRMPLTEAGDAALPGDAGIVRARGPGPHDATVRTQST